MVADRRSVRVTDGRARTHTDRRGAIGSHGEELAVAHLREHGLAPLARNVRTTHGEIDLIAFDGRALVFVEVKTRCVAASQHTIRADQHPLAGLGVRQRARLRRLAAAWLSDPQTTRPHAQSIRFDAVGVVIDSRGRLRQIEHVEGAW